jgi:retron-type reverse transcriptase
LSTLLSNIMLNELDKELEKRGHRFVRYADDLVILCKSKRSAERYARWCGRSEREFIPFLLSDYTQFNTQVHFIRTPKAFFQPQ